MISAGLLNLGAKMALALALASDPTPATAAAECSRHWTTDGDGWWDCFVALETYRCERQGWCDPHESAPYELAPLPDPARPPHHDCDQW